VISGVNSPFPRRPFLASDRPRPPSSDPDRERLSREPEALMLNVDVDALGLGAGEFSTLAAGDRRGEGRGNSWSSSSSSMGDAFGGKWSPLGLSTEEVDEEDVSRSCSIRMLSASANSWDLRLLSTSSTVREKELRKREPAFSPWHDGVTMANSDNELPAEGDLAVASSRLALRRLRAPRENFSCHCSPSLRDSSVMWTQSGQHARRGTVSSIDLRWWFWGRGRDGRRTGFIRGVGSSVSVSAWTCGSEAEEGRRWTRQGESGFGEPAVRPRLGERDLDLVMKLRRTVSYRCYCDSRTVRTLGLVL